MKNKEIYKLNTFGEVEDCATAFMRFCKSKNKNCKECPLGIYQYLRKNNLCILAWLRLEKEKANLLPCPFCGGQAMCEKRNRNGHEYYTVVCHTCGISTLGYASAELSIESWTRRVDDKDMGGVRFELGDYFPKKPSDVDWIKEQLEKGNGVKLKEVPRAFLRLLGKIRRAK